MPKNVIKCPFCKIADIDIIHVPSTVRFKKGSYGGSKKGIIRTQEKYEVLNKCPNCGKSAKEIERALETGIIKELSHEERLKRLKEAGLPTRIETKH